MIDAAALDRHIVLAGGFNFRDLGGYPTRDGGGVKWRTIFRSRVLDQLTDEDCATVEALGITTVIDLRGNGEREQRPSRGMGSARVWAQLFVTLAAASGPVLFHCTGGKDRTGVGAALLLDALGVERETIVDDYTLTNHCGTRDAPRLESLSLQVPREMRVAAPDYLEAMFARLDAEFGGAAGYLERLGLADDTITRLQHHYVEGSR